MLKNMRIVGSSFQLKLHVQVACLLLNQFSLQVFIGEYLHDMFVHTFMPFVHALMLSSGVKQLNLCLFLVRDVCFVWSRKHE